MGNHDNHRVASRLHSENVDAFNMLLAILPGVMVTYNGEEIGMEDGEVTCAQGHDPQAIKNCSIFGKVSRDFERTPYQWDNTSNAGFSIANKTWLPVSKKYLKTNLANQIERGDYSHYGIYKKILQFRKTFKAKSTEDTLKVNKVKENILQISRIRDDNEYVYATNFGDSPTSWKLSSTYEVVISSKESNYKPG